MCIRCEFAFDCRSSAACICLLCVCVCLISNRFGFKRAQNSHLDSDRTQIYAQYKWVLPVACRRRHYFHTHATHTRTRGHQLEHTNIHRKPLVLRDPRETSECLSVVTRPATHTFYLKTNFAASTYTSSVCLTRLRTLNTVLRSRLAATTTTTPVDLFGLLGGKREAGGCAASLSMRSRLVGSN